MALLVHGHPAVHVAVEPRVLGAHVRPAGEGVTVRARLPRVVRRVQDEVVVVGQRVAQVDGGGLCLCHRARAIASTGTAGRSGDRHPRRHVTGLPEQRVRGIAIPPVGVGEDLTRGEGRRHAVGSAPMREHDEDARRAAGGEDARRCAEVRDRLGLKLVPIEDTHHAHRAVGRGVLGLLALQEIGRLADDENRADAIVGDAAPRMRARFRSVLDRVGGQQPERADEGRRGGPRRRRGPERVAGAPSHRARERVGLARPTEKPRADEHSRERDCHGPTQRALLSEGTAVGTSLPTAVTPPPP